MFVIASKHHAYTRVVTETVNEVCPIKQLIYLAADRGRASLTPRLTDERDNRKDL